jgi:hypothetical protein
MSRLAGTETARRLNEAKNGAPGERGKKSEKAAKDYLTELSNTHSHFDWQRELDARAAGGRFGARTGDFCFYMPGCHGVLEVKEVKHACRLPKANFGKDPYAALARLRRRQTAGGMVLILVYHSPIKRWRLVPLNWILIRSEFASFDLTEIPCHLTVAEALTHLREDVEACHA